MDKKCLECNIILKEDKEHSILYCPICGIQSQVLLKKNKI